MKNSIKNQTGSLLSSAIVIIALLSLTLTTVTAQTHSIATRTNATVNRDDEIVFSQTMVQSVLQDIRLYILDKEFTSFDQFGPLEDEDGELDRLRDLYNVMIAEYYEINEINNNNTPILEIEVSSTTTLDENRKTRKYIAIFTQSNGSKISKELNLELNPDEGETPTAEIEDVSDIRDFIFNEYLTEEKKEEIGIEREEFSDLYFSGAGTDDAEVTGDHYVTGDVDYNVNGRGGSSFGFSDSFLMIVEGDINFEYIHKINGPGLMIIDGDLTIDNWDDTSFNEGTNGSLIIIVDGAVTINMDHPNKRDLTGDNFHIISAQESDTSSATNNNTDDFHKKEFNSDNNNVYHYLGSDEDFRGLETVLQDYEDIFGSNIGFSGIFSYFESSFETE